MNLPSFQRQAPPPEFGDESRIIAEGQKDGERNIPEMGSYMPAPFEQALIANGEQAVQGIYKIASLKIARLRPVVETYQRRLDELERRMKPLAAAYHARLAELGRDATILFPPFFHWVLILFLALGEFPLNTVVFRLFGEAEYLTYVMASTLAIIIPLIGVFIGVHMRHSLPKTAGNILIGFLTPVAVGAALYAVSLLRNTYIQSQFANGQPPGTDSNQMAHALFALNSLVFFGAAVASYFAHDPDEKLDVLQHSVKALDRKKNAVRSKLFQTGTKLNGEIQQARSEIEQVRALTNQRVALYRQTNIRFRRLLPPPSFRKNAEFPPIQWWPEVSLNNTHEGL